MTLPYIPELIARKLSGPEQAVLPEADLAFHHHEYERLVRMLEQAAQESSLPEGPALNEKKALNDLLIRLRLRDIS